MTPLRTYSGVFNDTFEQLRCCSEGRIECVTYWTGPVCGETVADQAEQPLHRAGYDWYEVDRQWLCEFFVRLRGERRKVVAQVHTHPHEAWHSSIDDVYAVVPSRGFLSLVLPNFAQGPISLAEAYLVELDAEGKWRAIEPAAGIVIKP